jgi:hypothetical protein
VRDDSAIGYHDVDPPKVVDDPVDGGSDRIFGLDVSLVGSDFDAVLFFERAGDFGCLAGSEVYDSDLRKTVGNDGLDELAWWAACSVLVTYISTSFCESFNNFQPNASGTALDTTNYNVRLLTPSLVERWSLLNNT